MVLQFVLLVAVLCAAHYTEHSLEKQLEDVYIALPTSPDEYDDDEDNESDEEAETPPSSVASSKVNNKSAKNGRKARRWSTPPSLLVHTTDTSQGPAPQASVPGIPTTMASAASQLHKSATPPTSRTSRHVSFGQTKYLTFGTSPTTASETKTSQQKRGFRKLASISTNSTIQQRYSNDKVEKIRLWLGIAYGSASGTMSGLCLLFAKTGVELLILTVVGQNQFKRWESWMIVLALLVCALLQVSELTAC
jgi:cation transport regulator ChaB